MVSKALGVIRGPLSIARVGGRRQRPGSPLYSLISRAAAGRVPDDVLACAPVVGAQARVPGARLGGACRDVLMRALVFRAADSLP